jgi:hypothetical protein
MATCQNGLPVLTSAQCVVYPIGATVKVRLAPGPEGQLLAHFARWFDANIRDLDPGILDDWGWADRKVRGSDTDVSNHAGGYAVDLNATKWPLGAAASVYLTAAEIARVHEQLAVYEGCLRWGGDYAGRTDPMHVECLGDRAKNARVWAKLSAPTSTLESFLMASPEYTALLGTANNAAQIASEVRNWILDPTNGILKQLGAISGAVQALATSKGLDGAQVVAAAEAGARAALHELGATLTTKQ